MPKSSSIVIVFVGWNTWPF